MSHVQFWFDLSKYELKKKMGGTIWKPKVRLRIVAVSFSQGYEHAFTVRERTFERITGNVQKGGRKTSSNDL